MKAIRDYFAEIGSKGGKKSRRELTPEQARAMVAAREAKRKPKKPRPTPAARQRPNKSI